MSETIMANLTINITSLSSGVLLVSADRHYTVDLMLQNQAGSNLSTAVATISKLIKADSILVHYHTGQSVYSYILCNQ